MLKGHYILKDRSTKNTVDRIIYNKEDFIIITTSGNRKTEELKSIEFILEHQKDKIVCIPECMVSLFAENAQFQPSSDNLDFSHVLIEGELGIYHGYRIIVQKAL